MSCLLCCCGVMQTSDAESFCSESVLWCSHSPLNHPDSFVQHVHSSALSCGFSSFIFICRYLRLIHLIAAPRSICSTCRLWIRGPRRPTLRTGSTPTATLAVTGTMDTPSDDGDDTGHHKSPLSLQKVCVHIHSNTISTSKTPT